MFNLFGDRKDEKSDGDDRVPPGQSETKKWPVLHAGSIPQFDQETWDFRLFGLVDKEKAFTWQEFLALPRVKVKSDIHCVTGWSKLDNEWEGVAASEVLKHVDVSPDAQHVVVHAEQGYTANMPLDVFHDEDVLFALKHNGEELTPEHGYPVRLVVPKLYFWKSAKWVRGLEFLAEDRRGFWEVRGYHNEADPWKEQRYSRS